MKWEIVIGLEIHVQLATESKLFSGAAVDPRAAPNSRACAVDLGLPGVLPVINREAVRMAVTLGLAVGGHIAPRSIFARKNYFYPDLPKGYQISQYEQPVISGGSLEFALPEGGTQRLRLTRIHMEEDAGKSVHESFPGCSGVDLNRAGTPLLEVVSEPELRSPAAAAAFLRKLHTLVRGLGVSHANMEQGGFRCDANISLRRQGEQRLGIRSEIKNLNSFRFVERALEYEAERHIQLLERGEQPIQETRLYDAARHETRSMRGKEEAEDYRYFPDPDLPPLEISPEFIEEVRRNLPELPEARAQRLVTTYGIEAADAAALIQKNTAPEYFEQMVKAAGGHARRCLHWMQGELYAALKQQKLPLPDSPVNAAQLGKLVGQVAAKKLTTRSAVAIFQTLWKGERELDELLQEQGASPLEDEQELTKIITEVLHKNPKQLAQYRSGKSKLLAWFVGRVLAATQGKADPALTGKLLRRALAEPGEKNAPET